MEWQVTASTQVDDLKTKADFLFRRIAELTADTVGVSRPSFGEGESKAIEFLETYARSHGIHTWRDRAGNINFRLEETAPDQVILTGSHMDSVPQGGNYDGLAGVIAGLVLLIDIQRSGHAPKIPLQVIGIRGEESAWFGQTYVGSKSLLGLLDPSAFDAERRVTGKPLRTYLERIGADVAAIANGEPLIDPSGIRMFLELHIEQGPVLVSRDLPLGIVTGIRGNVRYRIVRCVGESGHSGAVPRWLRRDAVFAVSDLVSRLDDHWQTIEQHGGDLVLTVGTFHTDAEHDAMSRVPGETEFSFEARSQSETTLEAMKALLKSECETIEQKRKVQFHFDAEVRSASAQLAPEIIEGLCEACREEGYEDLTLPSGAGHDASIFANAGIPSGMIFIRNRNGSHNPEEAMDMVDFMAGVAVMRRFLNGYGAP